MPPSWVVMTGERLKVFLFVCFEPAALAWRHILRAEGTRRQSTVASGLALPQVSPRRLHKVSWLTRPVLQSEVRKGGEAASCQLPGARSGHDPCKSPGSQCSLQGSQLLGSSDQIDSWVLASPVRRSWVEKAECDLLLTIRLSQNPWRSQTASKIC